MEKRVTVGRAADNNFIIEQLAISGHHAVITMHDSENFSIEDLGSTNGTYVNGNKVKSARITVHDKVKLGNVEISLLKVFGLETDPNKSAIKNIVNPNLAGINPTVKQKIPNDFREEFAKLRELHNQYTAKRQAIAKKYNMKMIQVRILISVLLGLASFGIMTALNEKSPLRYVISPLVMGVTMGVSMMAGNNPKKEEELKALKIELYKNYVCPNPKCKMQLGEKEWELWALNHTCPKCNAIWCD
jgi:pSer/pThr/pTyr-binding forkhead associated (FHA) protein